MPKSQLQDVYQDLMGSNPKTRPSSKSPKMINHEVLNNNTAKSQTPIQKSKIPSTDDLILPNISHSSELTNLVNNLQLEASKMYQGWKRDKTVTKDQVIEQVFGVKGIKSESSIDIFDIRKKNLLKNYSNYFVKDSLLELLDSLKDILVDHALQHDLMKFVNESDIHFDTAINAFNKLRNSKNTKVFMKINKDFSDLTMLYSAWTDFSARIFHFLVKPRDRRKSKIMEINKGSSLKITQNVQVQNFFQ